jgi:hypothetical protein
MKAIPKDNKKSMVYASTSCGNCAKNETREVSEMRT